MTDVSHPAAIDVAGEQYLRDAKGSLVPIAAIKPADMLLDELVRDLVSKAVGLSGLLTTFKTETFISVAELQALLAQQYEATIGGARGNVSLTSFDGCQRVMVQAADLIEFGAELQAAKLLIDECLTEWSADGSIQIKALVNRVFDVDKQGQINRAALMMLLRLNFQDDRWLRAMKAITDSQRVVGSKRYVRFYQRPSPDAEWSAIPLDLATA